LGPDERCFCWLFVLLVLCSPAFSQTLAVSNDSSPAIAGDGTTIMTASLEADDQTSTPAKTPVNSPPKPYGWGIAIYPVMAWAPVFGTGVTLPPTTSQPPTESGPSGSTDGALNGAYFGGARFERGKWSANLLFMWAGLSTQRETPFAKVDMDFVFGDVLGGYEVLPNLYAEGGVRRVALDVHATVGSDSASRSPGFWDPVIGLTYRRQLGKKWRILIHGDGGGFGAGSDVDVTATGRAEWQFACHFGLTMGYGGLHLSESNTVAGRTLKISPTLHGPIFGFGIFF
jgi:hypothetical protein